MGVYTDEIQVRVPVPHFRLNLKQRINEVIAESGFQEGHVVVQTNHTTTGLGLVIQEDERGLMNDFLRLLERIVPGDIYYEHDDFEKRTENIGPDERINAVAHLRSSFLQSSLNIIFRDGQLQLGTWQSVLLFDFDAEGRPPRTLLIQVCGE